MSATILATGAMMLGTTNPVFADVPVPSNENEIVLISDYKPASIESKSVYYSENGKLLNVYGNLREVEPGIVVRRGGKETWEEAMERYYAYKAELAKQNGTATTTPSTTEVAPTPAPEVPNLEAEKPKEETTSPEGSLNTSAEETPNRENSDSGEMTPPSESKPTTAPETNPNYQKNISYLFVIDHNTGKFVKNKDGQLMKTFGDVRYLTANVAHYYNEVNQSGLIAKGFELSTPFSSYVKDVESPEGKHKIHAYVSVVIPAGYQITDEFKKQYNQKAKELSEILSEKTKGYTEIEILSGKVSYDGLVSDTSSTDKTKEASNPEPEKHTGSLVKSEDIITSYKKTDDSTKGQEVKEDTKSVPKQNGSQSSVKKETQTVTVAKTQKTTLRELPKTGDATGFLSFFGVLSTIGAFLMKRSKK